MNFYLKFKETVFSVVPVMAIVLLLGVTIAPLSGTMLIQFVEGGILVIIGLTVFLVGVDIGILPIGERSGAALTQKRSLGLLVAAAFLIGFIVTVAEPDVQVLADQVKDLNSSVDKWQLIFMIAGGVGFFVALGILRTVLSIPLQVVLIISYIAVFALAFFTPREFQGVSFDSGGATTGPMTVPFIMALGVGVAAVRSRNVGQKSLSSGDESFGLTGIASIGPIAAVLIYGIIVANSGDSASVQAQMVEQAEGGSFVAIFPSILKEVTTALAPLLGMAVLFQVFLLKMPPFQVIRMVRGMIFSFAGLVIFLLGAHGGFMPVGTALGEYLGKFALSGDKLVVVYNTAGDITSQVGIPGIVQIIFLIATGCIFGAVVVFAEPAVWVLTDQVESISGGTIKRKVMLIALSAGVAISIGLSMTRILYGFSIWYILLPGYAIALLLTFFSPKMFTGIAFDSGGVASGPMTSTFILSFAVGTAAVTGENAIFSAFGVIALVAMTPLIAIQILGIFYKIKTGGAE